MHLDADELLAVIRREYPSEYRQCALQLQVDQLIRENQPLQGQLAALQQYGAPGDTSQQLGVVDDGSLRRG